MAGEAQQGTPNPKAGGGGTDGAAGQNGGTPPEGTGAPAATLEEWLKTNDEDGAVAGLIDTSTANLKKALQTERENNKAMSRQLREAAKGADDDTKKTLEAMADERDAAVRKAEFYALAAVAGCRNIDAAYLVANGDGMLSGGHVNIEAVKAKVPELFGTAPTAPGAAKAGAGTGGKPAPQPTMNELIRRAAGRQA